MESLERLQQSRRVVEDFSSRTLAAIPTDFGRLYYLSTLRDSTTGRYEHDGLAVIYSEDSVQQALTHCHEELFSRILETPLSRQETDLRDCLRGAGEAFWPLIDNWQAEGSFRTMCPEGLPSYLNELFCSNMNALLGVFSSRRPTSGPPA